MSESEKTPDAAISFPIDVTHIQVIPFAVAMDVVLQQNDHKGGWQDCKMEYLRNKLIGEVGEYFSLIADGAFKGPPCKKELVDIANFAMMLWDRS